MDPASRSRHRATGADVRTRAGQLAAGSAPGSAPRSAPSTGSGSAPSGARFIAAALLALVAFAATYLALVTTPVGQDLENLAVRGAELRSPAARDAALERLSPISVVTFGLAVTLTFLTAVLRGRLALAAVAAGVMVVSVVGAELLKEVLPRPVLRAGPDWILRNSFPSGSAAVATATAVGALIVVPDRLRSLALPVGVLLATVVGDAIQTAGWHRLSDTMGGTLLVLAIATGGLAILARLGLVQPTAEGRVPRPIWVATAVLALAALTVATAMILLMAAFPLLSAPEGGRRAFLQTAFPLFGAAFTILALLTFGRLLEPITLGRGEPIDQGDPPPARGGRQGGSGAQSPGG